MLRSLESFWIVILEPSLSKTFSQMKLGSDSVQLMTFGQPRVGNAAFASYFSKYVPNTIRVTHEHDIVPHLPPYFSFLSQLTYHHFPREVYLACELHKTSLSAYYIMYMYNLHVYEISGMGP